LVKEAENCVVEETQEEMKPSTAVVGKDSSSKKSLIASSRDTSTQYAESSYLRGANIEKGYFKHIANEALKNGFKQNTDNHYDYQDDAFDSWKNERIQ